MSAATEYYIDLKKRLDESPHGERGALVSGAAGLLRVSAQTVYRELGRLGHGCA